MNSSVSPSLPPSLPPPPLPPPIYSQRYFLGGFNRLTDSVVVSKTYYDLPVHDVVRIRMFAYEIDIWGPDSTYSVVVDGRVGDARTYVRPLPQLAHSGCPLPCSLLGGGS